VGVRVEGGEAVAGEKGHYTGRAGNPLRLDFRCSACCRHYSQ
jgi:hypothetical protein